MDHPGVRKADLAFYEARRAARRRQPRLPRLRPVERAPRHQLGEPDLHPQPRVLLLPQHRGALPRVAAEEVRHARGAERRVVPPARVVGRGRAQPPQHHPLVQRLRGLEALHRRQARRGPARALRGRQARRARPRGDEPRRRRRTVLLAALLGGAVRRLDDGGAGRPLRDVLLPEALGLRGPRRRVARGAARLRALVRLRANGGRGFWIGELQAGFGTIAQNVSPTVTPEDLRIWTWSALARGAKGRSAPTRTTR